MQFGIRYTLGKQLPPKVHKDNYKETEKNNRLSNIHTFLAVSHCSPLTEIGAPRRTTLSTSPSANFQLHRVCSQIQATWVWEKEKLIQNSLKVPLSPDSANTCKHLNITRAPNEKPKRVTGLKQLGLKTLTSNSRKDCKLNIKQCQKKLPVSLQSL